MIAQNSPAAAVATMVLMKASAANLLASRLEPALKPNQPTHSSAGADHGHGQRVRRHRLGLVAGALADHEAADQAGDARVDVHDGAAREIERAQAPQKPWSLGRPAVKSGPGQYQTMCAIGK
jgi:hypothetical protein